MKLRPAFVVTATMLTTVAVSTSCVARCPEKIEPGTPCSWSGKKCHEKDGCGLNGYECKGGVWREMMTYCNPPALPPSTPDASPVPAASPK